MSSFHTVSFNIFGCFVYFAVAFPDCVYEDAFPFLKTVIEC